MEKEAMERTGHQVTEEELEKWLKEHKVIADPEKKERNKDGSKGGQEDGKQ